MILNQILNQILNHYACYSESIVLFINSKRCFVSVFESTYFSDVRKIQIESSSLANLVNEFSFDYGAGTQFLYSYSSDSRERHSTNLSVKVMRLSRLVGYTCPAKSWTERRVCHFLQRTNEIEILQNLSRTHHAIKFSRICNSYYTLRSL